MHTQYQLYFFKTLTYLHAGTGKSDTSMIDQKVQRDHEGFPTVAMSGMKGGLREHFEDKMGRGHALVQKVFGGDYTYESLMVQILEKTNDFLRDKNTRQMVDQLHDMIRSKSAKGLFSFDNAHLLIYPMRTNILPSIPASSPALIKRCLDWYERYLPDIDLPDKLKTLKHLRTIFEESSEKSILYVDSIQSPVPAGQLRIIVEESNYPVEIKTINPTELHNFNLPFLLCSDQKMQHLLSDAHLPVFPRNVINENKESTNLWFEQFVPPGSHFYSYYGVPNGCDEELKEFERKLVNQVVKVGGNISVGSGRLSVSKSLAI